MTEYAIIFILSICYPLYRKKVEVSKNQNLALIVLIYCMLEIDLAQAFLKSDLKQISLRIYFDLKGWKIKYYLVKIY